MPFCPACGAETADEDSFCMACGAPLDGENFGEPRDATPVPSDADARSPVWPLGAVAALYLGFVAVSWDAPPGVAAGLLVVLSLPVVWYDAREAVRAGELTVERPVYVVLAVLLLWLVTVPAYVAYRVYTRRERGRNAAAQ